MRRWGEFEPTRRQGGLRFEADSDRVEVEVVVLRLKRACTVVVGIDC